MIISDWMVLLSVVIVVVGWFVNSHLSRRHEIAKKRIEHRLDMLKKYLSFCLEAEKSKSLHDFNDIHASFLLYGQKDEIELALQIADAASGQQVDKDFLSPMRKLNILVRDRLREQLGLPKIV